MLIFHIWCITTIIITGSSLQRIVSCIIDQSRNEILYFCTIFLPLGDFSNTVLLDDGNTTQRNPSGYIILKSKAHMILMFQWSHQNNLFTLFDMYRWNIFSPKRNPIERHYLDYFESVCEFWIKLGHVNLFWREGA